MGCAGLIDAPIIHGRVHSTHQLDTVQEYHHHHHHHHKITPDTSTSNSAHHHSYPAPAQQQGKE
jgi:hypothetical protein